MKPGHIALATMLLLSSGSAARAYDPAPVSDPGTHGLSSSRLARIAVWQRSQIDAGAFSGAVAAIARDGKVAYLQAVGFRDRAKAIPLQSDAIFWIASMTKPVTSVAAMMLVEEGKLDLATPVSQYLPELKDTMVAVEARDAATGKTSIAYEPQRQPMTVEDLLRHTAGFIHGSAKPRWTSYTSSISTTRPASFTAIRPLPKSFPNWPRSPLRINQARSGTMVTRSMCLGASLRSFPVNRSTNFLKHVCSSPWA
jgi:CubicO group peptidase (beta-lactamase class C family)